MQTFSCTECEFKTKYIANLNCHVKTIHKQEQQFTCDQCSFSTLYLRNLKVHIKGVHDKKEKLKCPQCDFSSAYKSSLIRHSNEIHGIRKWFDFCIQCKQFLSNWLNTILMTLIWKVLQTL